MDYQIDVDSIRSDEYMTSANTKWTYKDETEKVLAECGESKLMINSERSDAYWIKRKGKDWFIDTNKDGSTFHTHGEPYSEVFCGEEPHHFEHAHELSHRCSVGFSQFGLEKAFVEEAPKLGVERLVGDS